MEERGAVVESRSTQRKSCHSSNLSVTNPTWAGLRANPGLCLERSARRLTASGMALVPCCLWSSLKMNLICTQLHVLNSRSPQKKFTRHTGIFWALLFSV